MSATLPQHLITRKEEIAQSFLQLAGNHIADMLQSRTSRRMHARDFAALLFIHPGHLTNTIKLVLGKSPCDILEEKITAACRHLLCTTNLSIADIGYRFGYSEPTNFVRFFKSMTGITPLQYRRQQPRMTESE